MNKKTLYLASPYGFSEHSRDKLLGDFVCIFEELGIEVWEPFTRNSQVDLAQPGEAYKVAIEDLNDVRNADAFFAIVNGIPPDEGVMVELGFAIALRKPIFLFRDDFRKCSDTDEFPLNLMLFSGMPYPLWQDHYYKSLSEISRPEKGLMRWLSSVKTSQ